MEIRELEEEVEQEQRKVKHMDAATLLYGLYVLSRHVQRVRLAFVRHLDRAVSISPASIKGKPAARACAGPRRSARSQLDEPGERRERPRRLAAESLVVRGRDESH